MEGFEMRGWDPILQGGAGCMLGYGFRNRRRPIFLNRRPYTCDLDMLGDLSKGTTSIRSRSRYFFEHGQF